jgi:hypothetical protein
MAPITSGFRWLGVLYVLGFFALEAGLLLGPAPLESVFRISLAVLYWPGGLVLAALAVIGWNIQHSRIHQQLEREHGPLWQDYCTRCRRGWEREHYSSQERYIRDKQRERLNKEEHDQP